MKLSKRMRAEVYRCRERYGGVEEYDAYYMDKWMDGVAQLEAENQALLRVARAAKYYFAWKDKKAGAEDADALSLTEFIELGDEVREALKEVEHLL